jgi:hypothetical protein
MHRPSGATVQGGTSIPSLTGFKRGAGNRARTDDLLITNQLLYQLSYAGTYFSEKALG